MKQIWYFENLTVRAWLLHIFPRLIRQRLRGARVAQARAFDASSLALGLARCLGWIAGTSVRQLRFRSIDARDENGTSIWLRVAYSDIAELQKNIRDEKVFQQFVSEAAGGHYFPFYAAKVLSIEDLKERYTLTRALLVVRYCAWHNSNEASNSEPTLFLERRPWLKNLQDFGRQQGVGVTGLGRTFSFRHLLLSLLSPADIAAIRKVLLRPKASRASGRHRDAPLIAVQHYGQLNLSQPEFYSDVFFWQNSELPGKDLLLLFSLPQVPVDRAIWNDLAHHNINGVALDP